MLTNTPDIVCLHEHWLTPDNMNKLDNLSNYIAVGSFAMVAAVLAGIMSGKPYGGVSFPLQK